MDEPVMFHCERRTMRLSVPGCARLWTSAQESRPEPWEGRMACLTCPIGAAHAGKPVVQAAQAIEALRMICPRCERPAARLINGRHCVSCYNRVAECARGRDRKGNRPGLLDRLRTSTILIFGAGQKRLVTHANVVADAEVLILEAKASAGLLAFATKPPPVWAHPQRPIPLELPVIAPPPLPAWMTA